jgi:hypothetical protein
MKIKILFYMSRHLKNLYKFITFGRKNIFQKIKRERKIQISKENKFCFEYYRVVTRKKNLI